ncbi:hypothetical protein Tco_0423246, partial [Tanacetum coccineum]
MNESKATMIGRAQKQFESTGEMVKNLNRDLEGVIITNEIGKVGMDQDAAVTPKLMNPSMDQG